MARKKKAGCDLKDAAGKCVKPDVEVARKQVLRLLADAERNAAKHPQCGAKLETARAEIKAADATSGSPLELRNAYVRASFHAGQANACAVAGTAGPRQLTKFKAKSAAAKTAREAKAAARAAKKKGA